jgi:uncharacterized protein (TIGR04255 family)
MVDDVGAPFGEEPVDEIPLDPAPLVKVIAQLRFPPVLSIGQDAYMAAFQEHVRGRYPVLRPEMNIEAIIGPEGVQQQTTRVWRFHDVEDDWSVVLSTGFVALETKRYTSRDDFIRRLGEVFDALNGMADPKPVVVSDRLGVRYVNRLTGADATDRLQDLIRPEMYGPLTMAMPVGMEFVASIGQAHFRLDGPQMQARWGKLPADAAFLPDVPPVSEPSWMLDIDVFFDGQSPFEPTASTKAAAHASNHAYRFFHWAMQPNFIDERRVR